jgi:hypothetical protein
MGVKMNHILSISVFIITLSSMALANTERLEDLLNQQDQEATRISPVTYQGKGVSATYASELCYVLGHKRLVNVETEDCDGIEERVWVLRAQSEGPQNVSTGAIRFEESICPHMRKKIKAIECAG